MPKGCLYSASKAFIFNLQSLLYKTHDKAVMVCGLLYIFTFCILRLFRKILYRKDTEPLYYSFMYSIVSLLSGIYPLPAMHSLLVGISVNNDHL